MTRRVFFGNSKTLLMAPLVGSFCHAAGRAGKTFRLVGYLLVNTGTGGCASRFSGTRGRRRLRLPGFQFVGITGDLELLIGPAEKHLAKFAEGFVLARGLALERRFEVGWDFDACVDLSFTHVSTVTVENRY